MSSRAQFEDTLSDWDRVARFYPAGAPFDFERLAERARAAAAAYPAERRRAMAEALERQNPGNAAAARFARAGTVAIVTGQQVGWFGGPALSLHKAMTAVRVSERLRAAGVEAVPIFWMATQDHDLAEVDHAWLLDGESELVRIEAGLSSNGGPVGRLRLGAGVAAALEAAERCCPRAALDDLRAAYTPAQTLGGAFAELFRRWFAPLGSPLLMFDPLQAPEADAIWQPYYLAAFDRQPELAQRLAARAEELTTAGYHVQVEQTAAASMLFLTEDEGPRLGLRRVGARWLVGETAWDGAQLRARIGAHPEQVSPAALLRPVLQDAAFPVAAQVTGPAETAYLAQSGVLFEALGIEPAVAWPRARVTLVDPRAQRLLTKYQLSLDDLRASPAAELLARRALPADIEQQAAALQSGFESGFGTLRGAIERLDPTLLDAAEAARMKIGHQLEQLTTRVARSLARRSAELQAQARHLDHLLFPQRQPQERLLAAAQFASAAAALYREVEAVALREQIISFQ